MTPSDCYEIYFRNIRVQASIGIHPQEREGLQLLCVSIRLLMRAAESEEDVIDSVVNYDVVRDEVIRLATGRHWDLQESLCRRIADRCLLDPRILGVIVQTEKPTIYPDVDAVGCRFARMADAVGGGGSWWRIND